MSSTPTMGRPISENGKRAKELVQEATKSYGSDGFTVNQLLETVELPRHTIANHIGLMVSSGILKRAGSTPNQHGRPSTVYKRVEDSL